MFTTEDYKKLENPDEFPLPALVRLSKLRRIVAKQGYEFHDVKSTGEVILLLEAARVLNCQRTKLLALQLLKILRVHDPELHPVKSHY